MRNTLLRGSSRICYNAGGLGGEGGGAGSGTPAAQDNSQGNSGTEGNTGGNQNNAGSEFDAASFWTEPKPAAAAAPANGTGTPAAAPDAATQTGQEIASRLAAIQFKPAFTPEVGEQIAKGELTGINEAMANQGRQTVQEALVLSAHLMQRHGDNLMSRVEAMIEAKFGGRDNQTTLLESFPSAKDPGMRPIVEGLFNQAMKLSNNDRAKAVEATKNMLKYVGKTGGEDLGITTPPPNPGDFNSQNSMDLVAELLAGKQ